MKSFGYDSMDLFIFSWHAEVPRQGLKLHATAVTTQDPLPARPPGNSDNIDFKVLKSTARPREILWAMVMAVSTHSWSLSPQDSRVWGKAWSRALTEWKYRRGTDPWGWAGTGIRRWLAKGSSPQARGSYFTYIVMFVLGLVLCQWKPRFIAVKDTFTVCFLCIEADSIFSYSNSCFQMMKFKFRNIKLTTQSHG